jgi:hypothetical protein
MNLPHLLTTVAHSTPEHWHKLATPTFYAWHETAPGKYAQRTFDYLLVNVQDADISLVLPATFDDDFRAPWVEKFPDRHATGEIAALRYRGVIVFTWICVLADGGRYLLPMPDHDGEKYVLPRAKLPLARLLHKLCGLRGINEEIDRALQRAGIETI